MLNGSVTSSAVNGTSQCEETSEDMLIMFETVAFWLEGVLTMTIGTIGLIGNSIAIPLLFSKQLDNIFNRVLVCLAVTDNLFILTTILESIRRYVVTTSFQQMAFIYFLYQLQNISLMCSNNITVVLAIERYIAVTRPIEYHINVTSSGASPWRRVLKYLIPTVTFSILFNIPKFFELDSVTHTNQVEVFNDVTNSSELVNVTSVGYKMTDLRLDSNYALYYVHLARLFVTGIIPFSALVYLNKGIYR